MRRAATVLVLGDPGPVRDELMLRPEIDVIWAAAFEDALQLLDVYRVEACIVSPEFEHLEGYDGFRRASRDLPVLVCRPSSATEDDPPGPEAIEDVLAFLARYTGLVFARYPRARIGVPVEMRAHGERHELESANLSVSGLAVRPFPDLAPGTRVELCIDLPEQPLYVLGRVVRVHAEGSERTGGVSFTDLGEGPRAVLARTVEAALPGDEREGRLFGELEVPKPRAVGRLADDAPSPSLGAPRGRDPALELPPIRELRSHEVTGNLVPAWFEHLSEDLSEAERVAAVGGDAPDWAHRVLRLRISLARARADTDGELPPALLDEAYRTFAGLERLTEGATLEMQRQVSSIRASLLRDVLGEVA